jgi:hypothetical protein
MTGLLQYLPYILGAGIAVLIVVCLLGGHGSRKHVEPWRPKQRHRRRGGHPPHAPRST